MFPVCLLLFLLLCCILNAYGSSGDLDPIYRECLLGSTKAYISTSEKAKGYEKDAVLHCSQSSRNQPLCEYSCMQWISAGRRDRGLHVLKYYGHWPFLRVWGMQEPASAVFSLLNIIPHLYALLHRGIRNRYVRWNHFLAPWLAVYPYISINAWIASTLYHISHGHESQHHMTVFSTSMYDYMSALMILVYALTMVTRKLIGDVNNSNNMGYVYTIVCTSIFLFMYQLYRMFIGLVTYDSHMKVCILLAVCHSLLWMFWIIFSTNISNLRRVLCLLCNVWFIGASMLELFDFEPLFFHFDAHSLWHAATIPLGYLWYSFWIVDVEESLIASKQTPSDSTFESTNSAAATGKRISGSKRAQKEV